MKKRLLAGLMAMCLVLTLLPASALAAEGDVISTGYCGGDSTANAQIYSFTDAEGIPQQATYYDNATWTLTENGTAVDEKSTYKLTISGAGPMGDFFSSWSYGRPWLDVIAEQNKVELTATKPYITELEIRDGITEIGERAFAGFTGITTIALPDTVTDVKDSAFNGCNQVTSIDFSDNLVVIEHDGFGNMSSLTSIQLPENLITIGAVAFEGASALSGDLIIPDGVRTIEHGAFANCTNLTGSLTLGTSVESIGDSAFGNCRFTGTLTIPDSVRHIGNGVFSSCQFTGLALGNGLEEIGNSPFSGTFDGKLIIPDQVTSIGDGAFNGEKFTSVRLGASVISVGISAFGNTTTIHSLDLSTVSGGISYGDKAFQSMANPNTVYVNDSSQIEKVSAALTNPEWRTSFAVTNGGVFPVAMEFKAGVLATPVLDGYSFMGWYTQDGTEDGNWGDKVSGKLDVGSTYYARWEVDETTDVEIPSVDFGEVTFDEDMPDDQTVKLEIPAEDGSIVSITGVSCNSDNFDVTFAGDTVTVSPKDSLNAGEYTGTVCVYTTVMDSEGIETTPTYWFDVSLTVEKKDSPISFAESSVSKVIDDEPFTVSLSGVADGAAVTYSSSNPDVAVVYSSGLVTIRGAGTTTITATADETLNYNGSHTSFTLTVTDPSVVIPDDDDDDNDNNNSGSSSSSSTSVRRYNIEADAGRGGEITPDGRVRVRRGENQTFRITADDGWEIADVEVDGESVGAVERYTFENVRTDHTISATFRQIVTEPEEPQTPALPFTDVAEGDWYYDAVAYCWENGIMDGTSGTAFAPNLLLNRAMMAQVLYNLAGGTPAAAAGFPDVSPTAWYADAVNWAAANGYVTGYDNGSYGPEDNLTREQLAVILYRYAGSPAPAGTLDGFADAASASDYAVDALRWAVGEGLLTGKDGGRLDPTGTASRAELAQILARFAG